MTEFDPTARTSTTAAPIDAPAAPALAEAFTAMPATPAADVSPEAPEAIVEPTPSAFATAVNKWRDERLGNSPLARNTEAWNHVVGELPELIARLEKLEKKD
jgi:hypothetical protein